MFKLIGLSGEMKFGIRGRGKNFLEVGKCEKEYSKMFKMLFDCFLIYIYIYT